MDKNWVHKPITSKEYDVGLKAFIDYGLKHGKLNQKGHFKCPCSLCCNTKYVDRDTLYDHLSCRKMIKHYSLWFHHGEREGTTSATVNIVDEINDGGDDNNIIDDMSGMLHDAFGVPTSSGDNIPEFVPETYNVPDARAAKFYKLAQMDELTMKLNQDGRQDCSGQNDIYGQVTNEAPGKIHCYGMGVKRGAVWEEPSSTTSRPDSRHDSDSKKLKKELDVVKKTSSKQAVTIAKQRRQIRRLDVALMSLTGKPSILEEDDDDEDEDEDEEEDDDTMDV